MELEGLSRVLVRASEASDTSAILREVVDGLAQMGDAALARIWLIAPGDICETCPRRAECVQRVPCLHLVASAGRSRRGDVWDRIDGAFRRFPLGVRKIGVIGKQGASMLLEQVTAGSSWIVDPVWAANEQIDTMVGLPLVFRGETIGVLAVFARAPLSETERRWLGLFCDGAAIAIANARALAEIQRLRAELEVENVALRGELADRDDANPILGTSAVMAETMRALELVARTEAAVLVLGESGVGKELVAQEIHRRSPRREGPFIKVNCAAIPHDLFESEFFGHVRGAFTGAVRDRLGRFALADGGTLFLDEIGEVPLELQSKLLRVLQEGTFERVGEEQTRKTSARIIAATNRDLRAEAIANRFRLDLYYRLATFPLHVAPLRERKEDIAVLAPVLVERAAKRLGMRAPALGPEALASLAAYDWPGNVRELVHVLERALILGEGADIPVERALGSGRAPASAATPERPGSGDDERVHTDAEIRQLEVANLTRALARANGQIYGPRGAAALLGIPPTTLVSRLRATGLRSK